MRIAVLSDVHSNYVALNLVVKDAKKRGVDDYWFLGDAIGYGWQPVETLDMLKEIVSSKNWVIGNHDALYANILHPGEFRPEAQIMMNHNRALIEAKRKKSSLFAGFMDKRFSKMYQPAKHKHIKDTSYFLSHNGFDWMEYNYYYFDSDHYGDNKRTKILFDEIVSMETVAAPWNFLKRKDLAWRVLFLGHTHTPAVAYLDSETQNIKSLKVRQGIVDLTRDCNHARVIVINPGSVGFPKDRWHYPSYVILDTQKKQVEFCRVMEYACNDFDQGYRVVRKEISEYIKDGLWKQGNLSRQNGITFVKYEISESEAKKAILKIEQEILNAPHPRDDYLQSDFRKFYDGNSGIDLSWREIIGNEQTNN